MGHISVVSDHDSEEILASIINKDLKISTRDFSEAIEYSIRDIEKATGLDRTAFDWETAISRLEMFFPTQEPIKRILLVFPVMDWKQYARFPDLKCEDVIDVLWERVRWAMDSAN